MRKEFIKNAFEQHCELNDIKNTKKEFEKFLKSVGMTEEGIKISKKENKKE